MSVEACTWLADETTELAREYRGTTDFDRRAALLDALEEVVRLAVEQA